VSVDGTRFSAGAPGLGEEDDGIGFVVVKEFPLR
jgi:hypothetical protein